MLFRGRAFKVSSFKVRACLLPVVCLVMAGCSSHRFAPYEDDATECRPYDLGAYSPLQRGCFVENARLQSFASPEIPMSEHEPLPDTDCQ